MNTIDLREVDIDLLLTLLSDDMDRTHEDEFLDFTDVEHMAFLADRALLYQRLLQLKKTEEKD